MAIEALSNITRAGVGAFTTGSGGAVQSSLYGALTGFDGAVWSSRTFSELGKTNWPTAFNIIPSTGLYLVIVYLKIIDGYAAGTRFGLDTPGGVAGPNEMYWGTVVSPAINPMINVSIMKRYNAGDTIQCRTYISLAQTVYYDMLKVHLVKLGD